MPALDPSFEDRAVLTTIVHRGLRHGLYVREGFDRNAAKALGAFLPAPLLVAAPIGYAVYNKREAAIAASEVPGLDEPSTAAPLTRSEQLLAELRSIRRELSRARKAMPDRPSAAAPSIMQIGCGVVVGAVMLFLLGIALTVVFWGAIAAALSRWNPGLIWG